MITVYGIKNCDTVKKARAWLTQSQLDYRFHDYRVEGITEPLLQRFAAALGWEMLLNKRSTTWRQLTEAQKTDLNADKALQLLIDHPTLIKRPILETGDDFIVGFNADEYHRKL
jgi:Spx/MgsR family transcriptional regulator